MTNENSRTAKVDRQTGETKVSVEVALDGGEVAVSTGVGFFDHMLELLGRHARLGLAIDATGDLETGAHHTVEDVAIVLGQAIRQALGDKKGIRRFGDAWIPMDEALAQAVVDVSGRPYTVHTGEPDVMQGFVVGGHYPTVLNKHVFESLAFHGHLALHVRVLDGRDPQRRIVHCGSGVTACHTLLALERAGLPGASLYVGSWSEWCRHPQRPRAP